MATVTRTNLDEYIGTRRATRKNLYRLTSLPCHFYNDIRSTRIRLRGLVAGIRSIRTKITLVLVYDFNL